jgi:hypothetical protein
VNPNNLDRDAALELYHLRRTPRWWDARPATGPSFTDLGSVGGESVSDSQEVPLFDVPATHERTPLPAVRITVLIECEVSLPGDLFRGCDFPAGGGFSVQRYVEAIVSESEPIKDRLSDEVNTALMCSEWEIVESTPTGRMPEGWSWERFADEIRHPTWRPIEGTP